MGFVEGSGSSGDVVDVLVAELVTELSGTLDEVALSVVLVVSECTGALTEEELSAALELLEVIELSSVLVLVDEPSVLPDKGELPVLPIVEELSIIVLVVDEFSTLLEVFVDELELVEDKLVENELSGVLTELSVSTEQAVRDAVSARVIIIAKKRFIKVIPFVYFI